MQSRQTAFVAALATCVSVSVAVMAGGGCSGGGRNAAPDMKNSVEELRTAVRQTVRRPTHAAAVLRAVDDLEAVEHDARASQAAEGRELRELNANYDATREQFLAVLQRYAAARAGFRERMVAARDQMIANTTDAEWRALAGPRAAVRRAGLDGG